MHAHAAPPSAAISLSKRGPLALIGARPLGRNLLLSKSTCQPECPGRQQDGSVTSFSKTQLRSFAGYGVSEAAQWVEVATEGAVPVGLLARSRTEPVPLARLHWHAPIVRWDSEAHWHHAAVACGRDRDTGRTAQLPGPAAPGSSVSDSATVLSVASAAVPPGGGRLYVSPRRD